MAETQSGFGTDLYSRPSFTQSLVLNSEYSKRVHQRYFKSVVSALYMIDTILYIIGEKDHIDQVQEAVSGLIDACTQDLLREIERLEKLRDDNGVSGTPKYSNPGRYDIEIVSPQVSQFVSLMLKMDDAMKLVDTLWLSNIIPNDKRADTERQWQLRIQKLARRIISLRGSAYREARARGKTTEVETATQALIDKGVDLDTDDGKDLADIETDGEEETEAVAPKSTRRYG
ncbi:hypothetical protein [Methylomonas koyamae]|uniref:hypothetical protein n=1 Tax=Methylomonas koyamae TaxID=702114 RepID=UPI000BC2D7E8|nr:hypothetical protein [Methylomonas koyamae]ATG92515.1 hypothetical protein MKLM6_4354 [Methylomonas koyamae]